MREPVTLLVHQASVSVHVNLEQGACQAKRHSVMPFSGKSISSYFAYFSSSWSFSPGLDLPQQALQQCSALPSSSCGCCQRFQSVSSFFALGQTNLQIKFKPVMVLIVEAGQLVPIATEKVFVDCQEGG